MNLATCVDNVNGYSCTCGPGYTGEVCETGMYTCRFAGVLCVQLAYFSFLVKGGGTLGLTRCEALPSSVSCCFEQKSMSALLPHA